MVPAGPREGDMLMLGAGAGVGVGVGVGVTGIVRVKMQFADLAPVSVAVTTATPGSRDGIETDVLKPPAISV